MINITFEGVSTENPANLVDTLVYVDKDGDLWMANPETGKFGYILVVHSGPKHCPRDPRTDMSYEHLFPLDPRISKTLLANAIRDGWFANRG